MHTGFEEMPGESLISKHRLIVDTKTYKSLITQKLHLLTYRNLYRKRWNPSICMHKPEQGGLEYCVMISLTAFKLRIKNGI